MIPQDVWDRTGGIDMERAWLRGELPRTPLSNLLGTEVRRVEDGTLTLAMPATPWFANTGGTFYGGSVGAVRRLHYPRSHPLLRPGRNLLGHAR
ncbi:MAG TPA: hypothetical protein VF058_00450, partial [Actinomycetota bacterium]